MGKRCACNTTLKTYCNKRKMAQSRQVTCIQKPHPTDPHERISHLGGSWGKLSEETIMAQINSKEFEYFVHHPGLLPVKVIIASHNGRRYLKTETDYIRADNLLRLPQCP